MLTQTRLETYLVAYTTRLKRGETLEDIDALYRKEKRLSEKDYETIHKELRKYM